MDFSGIVKAVEDFWGFVWPPIVCLAFLFGIVAFLAPHSFAAARRHFVEMRPSGPWEINFVKSLKRFGFDKLVPLIALFCLLFVLDVVGTMVVVVGMIVPPSITYNHEAWLIGHARDSDVQCLAVSYGEDLDFADLQRRIERSFSDAEEAHKDSPILALVRDWGKKDWQAQVAFYSCKFFVLCILVTTCVEITLTKVSLGGLLRSLGCLVLFSVAAGFFFFQIIYAKGERETYLVGAARAYTPSARISCDSTPADEKQTEYLKLVEGEQHKYGSRPKWWFAKETDADYFEWLRKEIKGQ